MLEYRNFIFRQMLREEPDALFVFGDNLARRGFGGQAKEMRGEPNAVGIPTKKLPSMREGSFFTDSDLPTWRMHVAPAFERLRNHPGRIVWPTDGLGTGLAQLQHRAPAIWQELEALEIELNT
tara:strand:- start:18546 stop:18914 length:369 start_codon:yes stop_codon:yes gene_type:complete